MRHRLAVRALILGALATASLLVFPVRTEAVPISGNLNIAGSVMVDSDTIDWLSLTGQTDNEIVVLSATEYMAVLSPLSQGDAIDLQAGVHPVGVPLLPAGLPDLLGPISATSRRVDRAWWPSTTAPRPKRCARLWATEARRDRWSRRAFSCDPRQRRAFGCLGQP
jgi:hypothetical protein